MKAGFTTVSAVIAQSGGGVDIEDVIAERKQELEMFEEADIAVDTTVAEVPDEPMPAQVAATDPADAADPEDENEDAEDAAEASARVVPLRSANG